MTDGPNSGGVFWGNPNPQDPVIATGTAVGTGYTNTTALVNALGNACVAGYCRSYNGGGFNDWSLPSLNECSLMLQNSAYIGNMNAGAYWTSTQVSKLL